MKKLIILITFTLFAFMGFSQHEFPFDMKINGDLTIDSVLYFTTTPAVGTTDTSLILDGGTVKYRIDAVSDSSYFNYTTGKITTKSVIDTVIMDRLGIGTAVPDSLLHIVGGAIIGTDILVGGGTKSWSPTLTWNVSTGAPTVVAIASVVNNVVSYTIDIRGTNDSGVALTTLNITLPYTPKDINSYIPVNGLIDDNAKISYPVDILYAVIDAEDGTPANRKLFTLNFSIANAADYMLILRGFYEITSK